MALSEAQVIGALEGAPESWKYTPVKDKRGYLKQWQQQPKTLHEVLKESYANMERLEGEPSGIIDI